MEFEIRSKNWFRRQDVPSSQDCACPQLSATADAQIQALQAQPNTSMNPSDLLAKTVLGKPAPKNITPADSILGSNIEVQNGASYKKKCIPYFGPQNGVRPTSVFFLLFSLPYFFGTSACAFNTLRRSQACWSKRSDATCCLPSTSCN